jgi:hypothetical protein
LEVNSGVKKSYPAIRYLSKETLFVESSAKLVGGYILIVNT